MKCIICHKECPLVTWNEHGECPHCQGSSWHCSNCKARSCVK